VLVRVVDRRCYLLAAAVVGNDGEQPGFRMGTGGATPRRTPRTSGSSFDSQRQRHYTRKHNNHDAGVVPEQRRQQRFLVVGQQQRRMFHYGS